MEKEQPSNSKDADLVGPILIAGALADGIGRAIEAANLQTRCIDRGSYLRVLVPKRCILPLTLAREHCGSDFRLPASLESVMVSFSGCLKMTAAEAVWELSARE